MTTTRAGMNAPWYAQGDAWVLEQSHWAPLANIYYETIFTQSNGYMGIRGYTEETNGGLETVREGYLAGVFAHTDDEALKQTRVNYGWPMLAMITLPELFACKITLNGEAFRVSEGTVESFRRSLNMRNGELIREVCWVSPKGLRTTIRFARFLSSAVPNLGVQAITVTAEGWQGEATLSFELDGTIPTYFRCGDRSFPHLPQAVLENQSVQRHSDHSATLRFTTCGTNHQIAITSAVSGGAAVVDEATPGILTHSVKLSLTKGISQKVVRAVAVVTSRDNLRRDLVEPISVDIAAEALLAGYDSALRSSESVWNQRWELSDVQIDGPAKDQACIRFGTFSMLQMAPFHTDNMSVPARAYAYNRYHGLYYWDSETFLLPQYLYTHPDVARNLLSFRHHTLPGARKTAARLGAPGACFPWMTDSDDGTEQAPWHIGDYVWHQNADIAYAVDQYVRTTGDLSFMELKGMAVIVESARFWMSRLEEDADGVVHLHDTVGPDELDKHGKDNGYTSLMVRRHLRLAVQWCRDFMRLSSVSNSFQRLAVTEAEVDSWQRTADRISAPLVPGLGIPLQDEFLLAKEPLDFTGLTADEAFEKRHTHRVVKQADIIVAMYLLQDEFTVDQMRKAYDFYEPMTLHYSSLSYNTHSIIANKIGRDDQAYDYFLKASGLDLDDLRSATKDGLHAAALGGTWQTIVYGFAGMRLLQDAIAFDPRLPAAWKSLKLRLRYRGSLLRLRIDHKQVVIDVESSDAYSSARAVVCGHSYRLVHGLQIVVPLQESAPKASPNGNGKGIQAVIFDLDGVIVTTDEFHFLAWKELADAEGIAFNRQDNERLRGVSRMESLNILLEKAPRQYSEAEKLAMAERKNNIYRDLLRNLSPSDILPGVPSVLGKLRRQGVKIAIGSSSKNAGPILQAVGLDKDFDAVVDGTHIQRSKPDPEVFLLAGERLGVPPENCLVVEDAEAGVEAGIAAGMKVLAVGSARTHPRASLRADDLTSFEPEDLSVI